MIGMIAAVTQNGVIGIENQLPFSYPEDMMHFKKCTQNSAVIMGKNTFLSIGRPLPRRRNIVITRNQFSNVETASSLKEGINLCSNEKDIWLIGGASIYQEGMMFADRIVLTITPDIELRSPAVRFPWINPKIFKLSSLNMLEGSDKLMLAIYKK